VRNVLSPQARRVRPNWIFALLAVWPLLVIPGFVFIEQYSNAPGRLAEPPRTWPESVGVARTAGLATVVMLAHPRCPCTRSSLRELARLMAQVRGRAEAVVLFVDPVGADWAKTDLWDLAAGTPDVRALLDPGGVIANQFGAYTSGQVLLYDTAGTLAFNGGVTPSRGHDGDNTGRAAIATILNTGEPAAATSSVFGCELLEPERTR
jgi:hypothetical protein